MQQMDFSRIKQLDPARIRLYNRGEKVPLPLVLRLIREGVPVPSNTLLEMVLAEPKRHYGTSAEPETAGPNPRDILLDTLRTKVSEEARRAVSDRVFGGTLVVKAEAGKTLGSQPLVFADSGGNASVTVIFNEAFRESTGLGLDAVKDNFELSGKDDMHVTVEFGNNGVPLDFVKAGLRGNANESSMYLPVNRAPEPGHSGTLLWAVRKYLVASLTVRGEYHHFGWSAVGLAENPSLALPVYTYE